MHANGVVEKPDVVGAIFGQTEGLLGPDLDLRELQMTGRVGRIEVDVSSQDGSSTAEIKIPSSLDATETALIAAALETIERVGPCTADIEVEAVEDVRFSKRDYIIDRAKELLDDMHEVVPESKEISKEIKKEVRTAEISSYRGLPAGPDVEDGEDVIVCEGRSDVLNLLRHGVKNAVAVGGTSVPDEIKKLARERVVTLFLDGDRGGDLIQKELSQTIEFDYVARAPDGKEVEELTKKEVFTALRDKVSREQADETGSPETSEEDAEKADEEAAVDRPDGTDDPDEQERVADVDLSEREQKAFTRTMKNLVGTRAVYFLDEELQNMGKAPLNEIESSLDEAGDVYAILFDGRLDGEMVRTAERHSAQYLVGMSGRTSGDDVICLTKDDI